MSNQKQFLNRQNDGLTKEALLDIIRQLKIVLTERISDIGTSPVFGRTSRGQSVTINLQSGTYCIQIEKL